MKVKEVEAKNILLKHCKFKLVSYIESEQDFPPYPLLWIMEMLCLLMQMLLRFKPVDAVYHSAIQFITADSHHVHHCVLYEKVKWSSLASRRHQQVYRSILFKLLNKFRAHYNDTLRVPNFNSCM